MGCYWRSRIFYLYADLLALQHFTEGAEGQTYWYLDGRGSVAGLTKHQGQSTHNYRYDAYGQLLPAQGNWTDPHNPYTFAGLIVFLAIYVCNLGLLIPPKWIFVSLIPLNQRLRRWMNPADGEMEAALENVKQWPPALAVRWRWFGLIGWIVNTAVLIRWITTTW